MNNQINEKVETKKLIITGILAFLAVAVWLFDVLVFFQSI